MSGYESEVGDLNGRDFERHALDTVRRALTRGAARSPRDSRVLAADAVSVAGMSSYEELIDLPAESLRRILTSVDLDLLERGISDGEINREGCYLEDVVRFLGDENVCVDLALWVRIGGSVPEQQ